MFFRVLKIVCLVAWMGLIFSFSMDNGVQSKEKSNGVVLWLSKLILREEIPKEEQEKVFNSAPFGKKKVVLSTNIAETSVTINGITTVIDSGLSKLNLYSPRTFTSSLIECPVSRASCNQRRGRAGRGTGPRAGSWRWRCARSRGGRAR